MQTDSLYGCFSNKENQGVTSTRNLALAPAQAPLLLFLDAAFSCLAAISAAYSAAGELLRLLLRGRTTLDAGELS